MKNKEYEFLEEIIKKNSTSFYRAFKKLPEDKALAVYAVYAFCRLLDDTVDLHNDKGEILQLENKFIKITENKESDKQPDDEKEDIWLAFSHFYHKYNLKPEPFKMMFQGQYYDLDFKPFKTKEELDHYCDLVAGSVGLMLLPILSENNNDEDKQNFALDLGRAMQYTNILRDVGEDSRRNRSYLPEDLQRIYKKQELYRKLGQEAIDKYALCQKQITLFNKDSRYPLLLAIYYYRGILQKLFKTNFDNENKRTYLNKWEKIIVLLKARIYYFLNKKRA